MTPEEIRNAARTVRAAAGMAPAAEIASKLDQAANRIEALESSLKKVMEFISNWDPNFIHDDAWPEVRAEVNAALGSPQTSFSDRVVEFSVNRQKEGDYLCRVESDQPSLYFHTRGPSWRDAVDEMKSFLIRSRDRKITQAPESWYDQALAVIEQEWKSIEADESELS